MEKTFDIVPSKNIGLILTRVALQQGSTEERTRWSICNQGRPQGGLGGPNLVGKDEKLQNFEKSQDLAKKV